MVKKINALMVTQGDKTLLTFNISASNLLSISFFNSRELDREDGIQREHKASRSKEIAEYLDSEGAVLANSIIINLELEKYGIDFSNIYNAEDKLLDMEKVMSIIKEKQELELQKKDDERDPMIASGKIAFVVDGQHRLRAFEFSKEKDFPLVVTALINLSVAEVAELFVKINYYQKPVNKSLVYDLLGISEKIFPQYYIGHKVVEKLNENINSPFYSSIKMLGVGSGFITQASLISAIEKYKIEDTFKKVGLEFNEEILYAVLFNYFSAIKQAFPDYWGKGNLFSRSITLRAIFKLMNDVLLYCANKSISFSPIDIKSILNVNLDIKIISDKARGLGGESGVNELYRIMKEQVIKSL
ncbi:DGQHR domain-containing protein [Geosporobacter ferrireducens]|uniref:DGQHR domain-containing protein n=1 Tax=Geosporobacter ferrireducens TaxID=1424294 RepID=UPI00139E7ECA|nr:DGQHR domain-containing protein [Geosporobacter ferrireducens]MTI53743.1 DGQHR domain-containing protein [Geosporobacter ferrireducens]